LIRRNWLWLLLAAGLAAVQLQYDPVGSRLLEADDQRMLNIKTPTLGGKQFWTDFAWKNGWRLQQNAITDHWRLLDDRNVRWAWGSRQHCQQQLDQHAPQDRLAQSEIVILLHGLMRSSASMREMGSHLEDELGCKSICFEYASSRHPIGHHAQALAQFIDSLPAQQPIHLVGHSMGNIVARHYLGDLERSGHALKAQRVKSFVMLGPPNQGAAIARQLAKTGVFGWIAGKGGIELGREWQELRTHLATPQCPFGIISGRLPDTIPYNPLVEGDSDFVVSVQETRLEGAADILDVPRLHSVLMDCTEVKVATTNFIWSGGRFSP
jgi:hypothetical protein